MNPVTILIIAAVVFMLARTVIRYRVLLKQVDRLNKILYSDRNPDEYVAEIDKLLAKPRINQRDKDINLIQKATGLFYSGRFEEVQDVLNNQLKQIPANGHHLYYQDLALSLIFGGNVEEGHKILEEARETLDTIKRTANNSAGIEFIYAVDDLYQGKYEDRKDFFIELVENGRNHYRKAMAGYCAAVIFKKEGNIEQMNEYIEKAKEEGQNSFVIKLIDELQSGKVIEEPKLVKEKIEEPSNKQEITEPEKER